MYNMRLYWYHIIHLIYKFNNKIKCTTTGLFEYEIIYSIFRSIAAAISRWMYFYYITLWIIMLYKLHLIHIWDYNVVYHKIVATAMDRNMEYMISYSNSPVVVHLILLLNLYIKCIIWYQYSRILCIISDSYYYDKL